MMIGESAKGLIYLTDAPTAVTRREVPEKSVTRQCNHPHSLQLTYCYSVN
jgi:hypothetical protein